MGLHDRGFVIRFLHLYLNHNGEPQCKPLKPSSLTLVETNIEHYIEHKALIPTLIRGSNRSLDVSSHNLGLPLLDNPQPQTQSLNRKQRILPLFTGEVAME